VSRFQFVADHRHAFEVKRRCEIVQVARSSFYAWQHAAPTRTARAAADAELADRIRTIHDQDRTQGAPRITAELNDGAAPGQRVNRKRVARVMRAHAMAGLRLRRRVRTTVPEPADQQVPDLLRRDFHRPRAQPALRRGHHLPADRRRVEPVPGHGHRLLLPPPGGVGDRRAHAHRPGHRRAHHRPGHAGHSHACTTKAEAAVADGKVDSGSLIFPDPCCGEFATLHRPSVLSLRRYRAPNL
jgi:HTH-like domain